MLSVRGKAALVLASQALSVFIASGSLLVTGRFFDPAAYGMVAVAFGIGGFLGLLTDWGVGGAHVRRVALGHDRNLAFGALVRIRVALLTIVMGLLALAWFLSEHRLFAAFSRSTTAAVLALGFVYHGLTLVRSLIDSTWQAEQKVHLIEALRTADSLLVLLLLSQAGLVLAAVNGYGPPFIAVGRFWASLFGLQGPWTVADSALLILGAYTLGRAVTLVVAVVIAWRDGLRVGPWDAEVARSYRSFAFALLFSSVIGILLNSMDVLVLGAFWPATEVGLYAGAQRLANLCTLAGSAVAALLFPRFAALHGRNDVEGKETTFVAAQRYLLLVVAPMVVAMVVLPREGIGASLGPGYLASAPTLRWLAAWALTMTLLQPVGARLMGEGQVRPLVVSSALMTGLNLALVLVLVPPGLAGLGARGAAIAMFVAALASLLYLRVWVYRQHATPFWHGHLGRILGCSIACGGFWWAVARAMPSTWIDEAWELVVLGFAGLAFDLVLLILVRELGPDDWALVRQVRHLPTSLKRGLSKE